MARPKCVVKIYSKGLPPASGGPAADCACDFSGFRIKNVPAAVIAAYFPIFFIASLRVIVWLSVSFFIIN